MKKNDADMDPLEELHAVKAEISRRFPTTEALCDYLRQKYDTDPPLEPPQKGRRTSTKAKNNARPAMRQRKSEAHT